MAYQLNKHVTLSDSADGLVVLDQRSGDYWLLNGTGAQVLEGIAEGQQLQLIAKSLSEKFDVSVETVLADVEQAAAEMASVGLISEVP